MRACVTCKVVVRGVRDELTGSSNHDKTHKKRFGVLRVHKAQ